MTAAVVVFWIVVLGSIGFFLWRRIQRKSLRSFATITAPLQVETWNNQSPHFRFGLPSGWREAREDEIPDLPNTDVELVAVAKSDQPDARWAEMIAWCVSAGGMDELLRRPDKGVGVRLLQGRLTRGPTKMRVAGGRAMQLQFSEVLPGDSYGSSTSVEQARVETFFEGIGRTWMFQLIGPADTLPAQLYAYQTALGTWQWTSGGP
jgi:hypothetical protein